MFPMRMHTATDDFADKNLVSEINSYDERSNSMKKFETPAMEVVQFNVEDVITTSGGNGTILPDDPV